MVENKFNPMDLKVGDYVIIENNYGQMRTKIIEKVTKTQIIIGNERFDRIRGSQIGGDIYFKTHLIEASDENLAKIAKLKKISKIKIAIEHFLQNFNEGKIPFEYAEIVYDVISSLNEN